MSDLGLTERVRYLNDPTRPNGSHVQFPVLGPEDFPSEPIVLDRSALAQRLRTSNFSNLKRRSAPRGRPSLVPPASERLEYLLAVGTNTVGLINRLTGEGIQHAVFLDRRRSVIQHLVQRFRQVPAIADALPEVITLTPPSHPADHTAASTEKALKAIPTQQYVPVIDDIVVLGQTMGLALGAIKSVRRDLITVGMSAFGAETDELHRPSVSTDSTTTASFWNELDAYADCVVTASLYHGRPLIETPQPTRSTTGMTL